MMFFQVSAESQLEPLRFANPEFSLRGRRRSTTVVLVDKADGRYLFLIAAETEEQGMQVFRGRYMWDYHLCGTTSTYQEITAKKAAGLLRTAEKAGYLESAERAIRYLGLELYGMEFHPGLEEYLLDSMPKRHKQRRGPRDGCKRWRPLTEELERIRQEATFQYVYAVCASDEEDGMEQIRILYRECSCAKHLDSQRLCVLTPQEGHRSPAELEHIWHMQKQGIVAVRITGQSRIEPQMFRTYMEISNIAARNCGDVLTVFCFDCSCVPVMWEMKVHLQNHMLVLLDAPRLSGIGETVRREQRTEQTQAAVGNTAYAPAPSRTARKNAAVPIKQNGLTELQSLIGLTDAKRVVKQALDYGRAQQVYRKHGFRPQKLGMHMMFSGNPGTAKTTVARLVAKIFKEYGILSKGKLIEVGRSDLVGKYVGWTAQQVKQKFQEAQGSVLFIDEAYALLDDREGQYGDEAINTIVQEMENHRQDMVVILAGYQQPMQELIARNAGLRSRISFQIDFPDYSEDELIQILKKQVTENERVLSGGAEAYVRTIIWEARQTSDFGNGRFVRTMLEKALLAQAARLMEQPEETITREMIQNLEEEDFYGGHVESRKQSKERKIGFTG